MTSDNSTGPDENVNATTQAATFFDSGWLIVAAVELYISYAVIGIGIIGTGANAVLAGVRVQPTSWGTTAATRVPRWRIGERPREVAQEGSTG